MQRNHDRSRRTIERAVLAGSLLLAPLARADVYTWADASGNVNVTNLAPPSGARVLHVTHEDPAINARAVAAQAAAREAAQQAQVQALTARVSELERAAQAGRSAPPPAVVRYAAPPAPPAPQVVVAVAPPAEDDIAQYDAWSCAWPGCGWPVVVGAFPATRPLGPTRHRGNRTSRPRGPAGPGGSVPVNPAGRVPTNPAGRVPLPPHAG